MIECRILFCRLYRFLDDLHAHNFFADRSEHLCDRTGTAVQIINGLVCQHVLIIPEDKFAGCGIKHFCSERVCLEKRKR